MAQRESDRDRDLNVFIGAAAKSLSRSAKRAARVGALKARLSAALQARVERGMAQLFEAGFIEPYRLRLQDPSDIDNPWVSAVTVFIDHEDGVVSLASFRLIAHPLLVALFFDAALIWEVRARGEASVVERSWRDGLIDFAKAQGRRQGQAPGPLMAAIESRQLGAISRPKAPSKLASRL